MIKFNFTKNIKFRQITYEGIYKELHKRHYITGGLGKNKSGQTSKWMEIYAQVSTRIIVFNRIHDFLWNNHSDVKDSFWKAYADNHFVQRSFFFNDICSNASRCVRDVVQTMLRSDFPCYQIFSLDIYTLLYVIFNMN